MCLMRTYGTRTPGELLLLLAGHRVGRVKRAVTDIVTVFNTFDCTLIHSKHTKLESHTGPARHVEYDAVISHPK